MKCDFLSIIGILLSIVGIVLTKMYGRKTLEIDKMINGEGIIENAFAWLNRLKMNLDYEHKNDSDKEIDNNGQVTEIKIFANIYYKKIKLYDVEIAKIFKEMCNISEKMKYAELNYIVSRGQSAILMHFASGLQTAK